MPSWETFVPKFRRRKGQITEDEKHPYFCGVSGWLCSEHRPGAPPAATRGLNNLFSQTPSAMAAARGPSAIRMTPRWPPLGIAR